MKFFILFLIYTFLYCTLAVILILSFYVHRMMVIEESNFLMMSGAVFVLFGFFFMMFTSVMFVDINVEPEGAAVGIVGPDLGVGEGVELAGFLLGELGQNICAQFLEPFLVNSFCHNYSSLNVAPFFAHC